MDFFDAIFNFGFHILVFFACWNPDWLDTNVSWRTTPNNDVSNYFAEHYLKNKLTGSLLNELI